jgi:hypothetical protein
MAVQDNTWDVIHASAYAHARSLLRRAIVAPRPQGALRYQCPITESFVTVTDDNVLATLARPRARLRCPSCGEMHLLTQSENCAAIAGATDVP